LFDLSLHGISQSAWDITVKYISINSYYLTLYLCFLIYRICAQGVWQWWRMVQASVQQQNLVKLHHLR